jgi:tellurite resistance protein
MPANNLINTARAFTLVALADGKISPSEEHRFARFVAGQSIFKGASQAEIRDAWNAAVKEAEGAQSFGGQLVAIRTWARSDEDKKMMMKAAQAAAVADNKLEAQENAAVIALAEALGLDPNKF